MDNHLKFTLREIIIIVKREIHNVIIHLMKRKRHFIEIEWLSSINVSSSSAIQIEVLKPRKTMLTFIL